ncbi:two-component system phosphate regulon sensor histidine kinase PhoR [Azospirillum fermentarium]|uniref:ATP-binding protein n=1 Tax=Azospirillum fermentarium TaxID=1233114 RepID=UPI0022269E88|nr:ATP-binding protein [Azospirillum fermentarium]MCW2245679.1 two-component system phosphate regulon sensor histidine kinase PhoR [Azospirillum fermentarium]
MTIPPYRLMLALSLLALPLAGALLCLVFGWPVPSLWAVAGAGAAAAGAWLLVQVRLGDLDRVEDYARRLADGVDEAAPEPSAPWSSVPMARVLAGTIARLHRNLTRKAADAAAQVEAAEAILEALHDPLVLVGRERHVIRANTAARGLFGERMVGRDLAASLRNPAVLQAVDAVLGGAASRIVEFTLPVPVERIYEIRVKPFRYRHAVEPPEGEGPAGERDERIAILTLYDITTIKRSEQMRADFIANASHELRTPLSSLSGFIETLRGPARDDPEASERFLGIMQEQASRMTRLVSDLLSLSRIELDEHMPPAGRVDIEVAIAGVIDALHLKAEARGIRLIFTTGNDEVPEVVGDEDQLTQVVQNLISNAIKYTRADTDVTITVGLSDGAAVGVPLAGARARGPGHMVSVSVADQGEGIPRIHLPRLTERFYRVDAARSRAMGGTGLGLAIVKHIVNRHRGRMTIESEVGVGSTFTIYLPAFASAAPVPPAAPAAASAQTHRGNAA